MPVERLPLDEVHFQLHQVADSQEDVVVILKRTKTVFEAHKEDFYRDKGSKRNNFVN